MSSAIVIVQCTGAKRDGEHPARELYDESDYFVKQRAYAMAVADVWYIQSAKYGLLHPDDVVASYDQHAADLDAPGDWAADITKDLITDSPPPACVEILGGAAYADPLTPELERYGYEVLEPLRGQRIGQRKQSLIEKTHRDIGTVP